jgi:hypothetical protein
MKYEFLSFAKLIKMPTLQTFVKIEGQSLHFKLEVII